MERIGKRFKYVPGINLFSLVGVRRFAFIYYIFSFSFSLSAQALGSFRRGFFFIFIAYSQ